MPLQVNTRLPDDEWEQIVEAMPGLSNAERMAQIVRQQLALLSARRDLAAAMRVTDDVLGPIVQTLREQRLQGRGSELAETLAQTVTELAALLLSHSSGLQKTPEKTIPALEALLVQRWSRATLQVLRTAALDPASARHPAAVAPEIQRILSQASVLQQATPPPAS